MGLRTRDAEAELKLPAGFRFHPTDEELVVHYLCPKAVGHRLQVPIIAEVDLYKYDPWLLPEKALFGSKEFYFFTPRDRKYPNGSRPNRSAGSGYWKATGADKPVKPAGSSKPLGIKKALVFYHGKAPKGVKTDWIMHEYRLADTNRSARKNSSLRLDDWVLCRLYNKKNNLMMMNKKVEEESFGENSTNSLRTPESDIEHDLALHEIEHAVVQPGFVAPGNGKMVEKVKEDSDWFMDLNLEEMQRSLGLSGSTSTAAGLTNHGYCFSNLESPFMKPHQCNFSPFFTG